MSSPSLTLAHNAHRSPPYDDASWKAQFTTSWAFVAEDKRWRQDFLGLHFRTLFLAKRLEFQEFKSVSSVVDMATMYPLDAQARPDLAVIADYATRAGIAAIMLYRRTSAGLNARQTEQLDWSIAYYRGHIMLRAARGDTNATVDDLRFLAAQCALKPTSAAPNRDWKALMDDYTRWCLVASKHEWPDLMNDYPLTRPYLEAFAILTELVTPAQALQQVWYSSEPSESLALPDLDGLLP